MAQENLLDVAKRVLSIANVGLLYAKDGFDRERYEALRKIGLQLMACELNVQPASLSAIIKDCTDYPTAKVDIRALVLNDKLQILMVKEQADNCWSLPGGWADIGKTPSEVAIQEVYEETGLNVTCKYLAAVFDKRMHAHPPQPFYVYKLFFYCELIDDATAIKPAFDVLDAAWFAVDALPPLSTDRVLQIQIEKVYNNIINRNFITLFD